MNREIKYNAWNKRLKKMFRVYSINIDFGLVKVESESKGQHTFGFIDMELLQFTGLKDKNGQDIYEGDIVQLDDVITSITFEDGGFQMITSRSQGRSPAIQVRLKMFAVIGNIFENPELLN